MTSPHFSTATTKVILVRHGRTTYNEQGRYQGSSDESVLTEKGYQDAFSTGLALQKYQFDVVYTSPLTRVQQTTQAILTALKQKNIVPPVKVDPQLTEIHMSDWQGLFYQEVKDKYATAYKILQETPHIFNFDNQIFPVLDLFQQAQAFLQNILNLHRGKTILIVAHGGTNRALISKAIGLKPEYFHSLQQSNCGISCLEFFPENHLGQLNDLNVTDHLGETLPKLKAGKTGYRWLLLSNTILDNLVNYSYFQKIIDHHSINLLLTENSDSIRLDGHQILHLSMPQNFSIKNWQQEILTQERFKSNLEKNSIITGIIVASEALISQIFQETLTQMTGVNLNRHFAVIHSPQGSNHSILQGILPVYASLTSQ